MSVKIGNPGLSKKTKQYFFKIENEQKKNMRQNKNACFLKNEEISKKVEITKRYSFLNRKWKN